MAKLHLTFIRKSSNVWVITIPKHLLDELEWVEDDILILSKEDHKLILQKGKVTPSDE